ncbi:TetR/AcrR family transcriptional regulator [Yinghuangia soli]|uniref:TetR/AcrR family transcriptional regulator n=1 Tax=Yinghuangia soli TaxID=2908204 RepID=A0AA41Q057_9ACTN|nr:TetR family transcriptional regulator [Yinghuangia soli]MCF2529120.1 TetR/AcrR family transcriptional regulator [Yinghuangia soli]
MAWDTARTKQLLLDAAVVEFAEFGPAGARVARIAQRAGVNKERIYQYFGSKEALFIAVLDAELQRFAAALPMDAGDPGDLGAYAAQVFDYHHRNPHVARLLAWEGLHHQDAFAFASEDERTGHYDANVAVLARAQASGAVPGDVPAAQLVYAVLALSASWFILPQLGRMLLPELAAAQAEAQRDALAALIARLVAPGAVAG